MSVSGLCEICGQGEAAHGCDRCGALVCEDHYDETLGLCVECAAEVSPGSGHRDTDREDRGPDGVDTYRF